jgi:hypothetical protein
VLGGVDPHQAALDQPLGRQRHLRLASLRTATLWGHIPAGRSGDACIEVFLARIDDE